MFQYIHSIFRTKSESISSGWHKCIQRLPTAPVAWCKPGFLYPHHFHDIIECLAAALEAKDLYTSGHSSRVGDMSYELGRAMGLKGSELENIHIAAHLHDIGKMGISETILNKKGRLLPHEFAQIQTHPEIGYKILAKSKGLRNIAEIVLHHHERWDGKGYPDGLREDEIPLGSRIIAVADSVDAITSIRPYRRAMSWEECWEEILINKGIQFDPVAVEASEKIWKKWKDRGQGSQLDYKESELTVAK